MEMSDEWNPNPAREDSPNEEREVSLLEAFDRAVASLPLDNVARERLLALRAEIAAQEEMVGDAREMIEKLEQVIKKVTSPANRIGTFLGSPARDTAQIVVGGADYYCNVDPRISLGKLQKGTRVLVNEAYVIVGDLGFETAGPVTKVAEVLGSDRLRVGAEHGTQSLVLQRSAQLAKAPLKAGDDVRVDANYRVALELLASPQSRDHYLDEVPELPWEKVGGQEEALQAIRDAILSPRPEDLTGLSDWQKQRSEIEGYLGIGGDSIDNLKVVSFGWTDPLPIDIKLTTVFHR
jgi:proteasome-associated ATPase